MRQRRARAVGYRHVALAAFDTTVGEGHRRRLARDLPLPVVAQERVFAVCVDDRRAVPT